MRGTDTAKDMGPPRVITLALDVADIKLQQFKVSHQQLTDRNMKQYCQTLRAAEYNNTRRFTNINIILSSGYAYL